MENFICDRTMFKYTEKYEYWGIDKDSGKEEVTYKTHALFKFNCVMMRWANNRVRVTYSSKALGGDEKDKENFKKFKGSYGNITLAESKDFNADL